MRALADRKTKRHAFTLVEMLTVVAIIALLITILVPAVNSVRDTGRKTATAAMLGTFDTAIATFRADGRIGGGLPPSASDQKVGSTNQYQVRSPYPNDMDNWIDMSGAGLLVWALAGADQLGTPGFKPVRSTSDRWSQDTSLGNGNDPGAYYVDPNDGRPKFARSGPFVDLNKVKITTFNKAPGRMSFDVPAEVDALKQSNPAQADQMLSQRHKYPMFLDGYGFPILYWRADPAGNRAADYDPLDAGTNPANRGIYHYRDNQKLLGYGKNGFDTTNMLILRPWRASGSAQSPHALEYAPPPSGYPADPEQYEGFWHYIANENIQAKLAPSNADSYLLVSPGKDGLYGTADDIANFDHQGAHVERDQ